MSFYSKHISTEELLYDPQNPRLPVKMKDMDETTTLDYMLRNGNIIELMQSIAELGYSSAEPLLVVKAPLKDHYLVVEGNRRLTALKLLNNPILAKVRKQLVCEIVQNAKNVPKEIPCIVYDSREEILNYLGYRHITGIKEWGSLEKAQYLKSLFDANLVDGEDIYKKLAKMIGSRSDYVERLLTAYELYCLANDNAYFGSSVTEDEIDFSHFTSALAYKSIQSFLNVRFDKSYSHLSALKKENYKLLFFWLFDPKKRVIAEGRQISTLSKIIESEKAIEKLKQGVSLGVARLYTTEPEEMFISQLSSAYDSLTEAKLSIEQLSGIPEHFNEVMQDLEKIMKSIRGAVEENFGESNGNVTLSKAEYEKIKAILEKLK